MPAYFAKELIATKMDLFKALLTTYLLADDLNLL